MNTDKLSEKNKGNAVLPLVICSCMVCGKDFEGEEPKMCCSGRDCGCMGMPIEPVVCSQECYDAIMKR